MIQVCFISVEAPHLSFLRRQESTPLKMDSRLKEFTLTEVGAGMTAVGVDIFQLIETHPNDA